ncbi:helix-turn-helix domain-containing protein [Micromonospora aurantiaca (nom. illeg.)]|uniref:helix-turn-helix domain-containing protein n=1 Tax=Micromonospora aurantiaca (nom. illeg.) TaxID=47850 RepID=UPI00082865AA|nr:helix-turn-helix transcriptional regulator [Micromonospora aurantiaca]SCL33492.1 Helix-turn-helix [Micromonospora aurantiaca]
MADKTGQDARLDDLRFALAATDNGDARLIRESALMSKAEMAAILGVSERLISHYENRTRIVSASIGRIYGALLRELHNRAQTRRAGELRTLAQACPACVVRDRVDYLLPLPHSCSGVGESSGAGRALTGDDL